MWEKGTILKAALPPPESLCTGLGCDESHFHVSTAMDGCVGVWVCGCVCGWVGGGKQSPKTVSIKHTFGEDGRAKSGNRNGVLRFPVCNTFTDWQNCLTVMMFL